MEFFYSTRMLLSFTLIMIFFILSLVEEVQSKLTVLHISTGKHCNNLATHWILGLNKTNFVLLADFIASNNLKVFSGGVKGKTVIISNFILEPLWSPIDSELVSVR